MGMLRLMRSTSLVRATICAAAVLSIAASAGLHPEPVTGGAAVRGGTGLTPQGVERGDAAAHMCLVCLLHAPATGPTLSPTIAAVAPSLPEREPAADALPAAPALPANDGRAPPLAS